MSGISEKMRAVPIVKPRLITVGRGRALPRVQTETQAGAAHHVGAVSQARPGHLPGSLPQSDQAVRDADLPGRRKEDSQPGLRRPKFVRQEPSGPDFSSGKEKNKMEEADMEKTRGAGIATVQHGDQFEQMKEKLSAFKEESGANLELLKKQIKKLQDENDKDLEIKRLNNELIISQKLLDIEANMKAKKGNNVSPELSPASLYRTRRPPPGNFFQFPDCPPCSPQYPPPPPPPGYLQYLSGGFLPSVGQSSQRAAAGPLYDSVPLTSAGSAGQPSRGEEMGYYSSNRPSGGCGSDGPDYNDESLIKEQEEILKQIEEQNKRNKMEETRTLKLIQKMSLEGELTSSGSSRNQPDSASSYDAFTPPTQVVEDSWTKVARSVGRQPGGRKQEMVRKKQAEVEESQREFEVKMEEWRREMGEKEERERKNILLSHLDSQKLRMIRKDSNSNVVGEGEGGPSRSPAPLTLGDILPTERRQRKVSDFEAERRKAVLELKQRIKDQVHSTFNTCSLPFESSFSNVVQEERKGKI